MLDLAAMFFFWIVWTIDALLALIALFFFFTGIGDGTVSSFNIILWLGILIALAALIAGSLYAKSKGHLIPACLILCLLAIPALLFVLYFGVAILNGERWN